MENIWERFDSIASSEEVKDATVKAKESEHNFKPLEAGKYNVTLESIEAGETQQGTPMMKTKLRTIEGNRVIFFNSFLQSVSNPEWTASNIANAMLFVTGVRQDDSEFTTLGAFATLLDGMTAKNEDGEIIGVFDKWKAPFTVDLFYGKNDLEMKYPKVKYVSPVLEPIDPNVSIPVGIDDEVPFL